MQTTTHSQREIALPPVGDRLPKRARSQQSRAGQRRHATTATAAHCDQKRPSARGGWLCDLRIRDDNGAIEV
ncbi:hypothetical protein GCM10007320_29790 [Pseudorhodoferax aquiterrae]|uniref:Uncharacterized protein n=1 Tax=Pseudorhodoferax aquiterrae TaxID=747304 RepID=A0ABQ3G3D2_9BURK|nr:hypothetical protein GCM10007320_29790 [Pseudorhodoferax aquiterrae]